MLPIRLVTLGTLRLEGSDWRPAKALTLLTYLSLQGPTSRRRLRELFWPQAQDAGASLRVVLGQFRRYLPGVVSGEETLEAAVESDAAHLLGLGERRGDAADAETYAGPFLAGAELSEVSAELEEWVLITRERLAGAARLAMLRAAELAGSPAGAAHWTERAAAISESLPPGPELLERMLCLTLPGSLLEAELRAELADLTVSASRSRLPVPEQELLGREREVNELLLALSDPAVRLLEITGPGGIGKSTLATSLLREQADLSGVQVLSVALESALASSEAAARMVVALGLQVTDRGDGWLALARAWGERPLLALLDGVEGIPDLGQGLATLLAHCPGVRLVITSRVQRLTGGVEAAGLSNAGLDTLNGAGSLQGAVHLALDGLSVPAPGESPARVARSAAVQLFVRGARRYLPRFTADDQNAPLVSAIVRRLDGHPLATVLSATWMRVYPPAQIHTLILQDLAALRGEDGGRERHQLSAVFERSWRLLTPGEAQAVSALAVFQGFTPDAALKVAGVTSALLKSLMAHSLLRTLPQGRLEVPPVLAAQAQAHLPDPAAVQDAHAAYYMNHLMTHAPESDEVDTERANIVAATAHSLSRGRDVSAQIDTLLASYDRRGLLDSGTDAFQALQEALPDAESEAAGSILVGLAWLANQSSRRTDAEQIAASILNRPDAFSEMVQMKATNIMAVSLMNRNDVAESLVLNKKAFQMATKLGDVQRQLIYSLNVCASQSILGNYDEALQIVYDILNTHGSTMTPGVRMLADGYVISVYYYSASLENAVLLTKFVEFLNKYASQNRSRPYLVTKIIYTNLLLDIGQLKAAELSVHELAALIQVTQAVDISLANRIIGIRLLYLQHRNSQARAEALAALQAIRSLNEEDGLCELLLVSAPDLLDADAALGVATLHLVADVLPHSKFQADRAASLLKSCGAQLAAAIPDRDEILNRMEVFLRSRQTSV